MGPKKIVIGCHPVRSAELPTKPSSTRRLIRSVIFETRLRGQPVKVDIDAMVGGPSPPVIIVLHFLTEDMRPLRREELEFLAAEAQRAAETQPA